MACGDLLRMERVPRSQLTGDASGLQTFLVQWQDPSDKRSWLREVNIVPDEGGEVEVGRLDDSPTMPNYARVRLTRRSILPTTGNTSRGK